MKLFLTPAIKKLHKSSLVASRSLSSNTVEVTVDGRPVSVAPGTTVMQACEDAGVHIPHFCYHKRLSIAGNCRMCLVEVEKSAKPVASCAMPALNGMRILTNSPLARKAREGVLEFILVNHPLDCPICDQGGECDLQDLSMNFGSDRSRFTDIRFDGKRAVVDKYFGPLIGTSMTKCIQCTRCVRFANQVAGIPDLGVSGRGSQMQIGMYVERLLMSELSGNVIDLCPVGALVSIPYLFTARPWELRKVESIDVMDALGSNIVISTRAGNLMKITPRINEDINEEWISDKARFSYDGLKYQRLTVPMIRNSTNNQLDESLSWKGTLKTISDRMSKVNSKNAISAVVGDLTDCETIMVTKDLLNALGSSNVFIGEFDSDETLAMKSDNRASYTFSNGLASVENSDLIVLINTNPRFDAPVFNARIRKAWMENDAEVVLFGPKLTDLTYPYTHLGESLSDLNNIASLPKFNRPLVILGTHNITQAIFQHAVSFASKLQQSSESALLSDWSVFNMLHNHASTVGALDLNCKSMNESILSNSEVIILLGYDKHAFKRPDNCKLLIYIGHHGDVNASIADIILPGCAYTEKTATFVNTEGRSQSTYRAISPPGMGRDDWKILKAISEFIGVSLPYETIEEVRARLAQVLPHFIAYNCLVKSTATVLSPLKDEVVPKVIFKPPIMTLRDFYMTDSISRNSVVMSRAVQAVESMTIQQPNLQQKI